MRGVFNDFTSEVNRSIGFYSSINRTAKIRKVMGLGNGFKLPGLQKFLQQNLSQEVDKVDAFTKLAGDEVKAAPQFQDNLASFAVVYGLGIQGLGKGGLSTNLLPPEIERVRLIRAKKPWALASSALVMLALFDALHAGRLPAAGHGLHPAVQGRGREGEDGHRQGHQVPERLRRRPRPPGRANSRRERP